MATPQTAELDGNSRYGLTAWASDGSNVIVRLVADPATGRLLTDASGGTGTVTTVSVATANGFSGTVANPTTTPAITIVAGAITPTSVNGVVVSGSATPTLAVTGTTSVSGSNTGDQTNISGNAATATTAATTNALNSATTTVNVSSATAPTNGQVLTATGGTAATWQTPTSGGTVNSGTANHLAYYATSTTAVSNAADFLISVGSGAAALQIGTAGSNYGELYLAGSSSGGIVIAPTGATPAGVLSLPNASDTLVAQATTQTLTNKRITKRVLALSANSATPAINTDLYDVVHITNQTAAITSFTSSLTGTPQDGDTLRISVTGTTAIALTFGASFEASGGTPLSTTTVTTARLDMGFLWNTETSKWRQVAQS